MQKLLKVLSASLIFSMLITNVASNFGCISFAESIVDYREKTEIIVKYKNSDGHDDIKNETKDILKINKLESKKWDVKSNNKKIELLVIDSSEDIDQVIRGLESHPDVEYAHPNYKLKISSAPEDPFFNDQWGLENEGQQINGNAGVPGIDINAVNAWDVTMGNKVVVVGIIDTGIDINHEDLKDAIYINPNEIQGNGIDDDHNGYIDDCNGWDFVNDDNTVYDAPEYDNHGTHIAGIIAAQQNSVGICGVAPNVKVLPLKFINGTSGYTSDVIEAIDYAKTMNIKIINCSFGGSGYNFALEDSMASSDILFVCAAGNSGNNVAKKPEYPASFDIANVISVAAIDNTGSLAWFSNYGKTVDIAAPGVDILSTIPENQYEFMNGTSMATPYVAGAATLVLSEDETISIQEMKSRILNNAFSIRKLRKAVSAGGILDAYATLEGLDGKDSKSNGRK